MWHLMAETQSTLDQRKKKDILNGVVLTISLGLCGFDRKRNISPLEEVIISKQTARNRHRLILPRYSSEWNWQMIYDLYGGQGETKGFSVQLAG